MDFNKTYLIISNIEYNDDYLIKSPKPKFVNKKMPYKIFINTNESSLSQNPSKIDPSVLYTHDRQQRQNQEHTLNIGYFIIYIMLPKSKLLTVHKHKPAKHSERTG